MKKVLVILVVLSLLLSLVVGCTSKKDDVVNTDAGDAVEPETEDVTVRSDEDPLRFTIGTAGTAGSLYPMGVSMGETITNHATGLAATGESTAASIENLRNLHEGNMGMGIASTEVASFAYYGVGDYAGNEYTDIRSMFSTLYSFLQAFTLEGKEINSIADLNGLSVGVGKAGSGGEMAARSLLEVYGMTYDDVNEQFMSEADAVAALKDGKIDAFIATHPISSAPLAELVSTADAKLIPIADEKFYNAYPSYTPYTVVAGTYEGIDEDVVIPKARIIMCTSLNSGLTEDDIYEITKSIWENRSEWSEASASVSRDVTLENALTEIDIPMHTGAIKYFEEIGVTVPEKLKAD